MRSVFGLDLRVHLEVADAPACGAEPGEDMTQLLTHALARVTCSGCLVTAAAEACLIAHHSGQM